MGCANCTERMIRVTMPFAVFGLAVRGGRVVSAAPIARYAVGWTERKAVAYFERRGGTVEVTDLRG